MKKFILVQWVKIKICYIIQGVLGHPKFINFQGHPTDRFGKLSVRKAINPLHFSKEEYHLELS
jgi:hypothetical protein